MLVDVFDPTQGGLGPRPSVDTGESVDNDDDVPPEVTHHDRLLRSGTKTVRGKFVENMKGELVDSRFVLAEVARARWNTSLKGTEDAFLRQCATASADRAAWRSTTS